MMRTKAKQLALIFVLISGLCVFSMAQRDATSFPGSDIGAQLNACIAAYPSPNTPGVCTIPSGFYSLTTTVIKPQWVTIEGNNAVITVKSAPRTSTTCLSMSSGTTQCPAIIAATTNSIRPIDSGTYSRRGIRNLTLIGSGPSSTPYGIWLGGDPSGAIISPRATDFLEQFDNVHVQNFGSQYVIGRNVYQESWFGGTIMGGYYATEHGVMQAPCTITPPIICTGGAENLTFNNTMFVAGAGNMGYAINIPDSHGSTINLDHVSIDFWGTGLATKGGTACLANVVGTGQILFNDGHLTLTDAHMETCSGIQIIANDGSVQTDIAVGGGTEFSFDDIRHSLATPEIIEVNGSSPMVNIAAGSIVQVGSTQTVGAYVRNNGTGGTLWLGSFRSLRGRSSYQIPPYSGLWNSAIVSSMAHGAVSGLGVTGTLYVSGGLLQQSANQWAGKCTMSGTSCTIALANTFNNYLCFASIDPASTLPSMAIAAKCGISGSTVTISAGVSNSLTWDALLIGNPN